LPLPFSRLLSTPSEGGQMGRMLAER
jgi:hypothetical protein